MGTKVGLVVQGKANRMGGQKWEDDKSREGRRILNPARGRTKEFWRAKGGLRGAREIT